MYPGILYAIRQKKRAMKIKIIISILISTILVIGCKKNEEEPFDGNELLTIKGNLIFPSYPTYIFLSDKDGKILTCKEHTGLDPRVLSNNIPMEDDYFDLSIVRSINSTQNILRIETYPNVQRNEWQLKSQYSDSTIVSSSGDITFLADGLENNIEYALIDGLNGSMTGMGDLKTNGAFTTQYSLNENYIFFRFKMVGEDQYRYVEFNNLNDGDTIALDIANYPLGELKNIQSNGADLIKIKQLNGLRIENSFENSSGIYSHNIFIQDYLLPDGKVWYPNGIFNSFFTQLEMKKDSFEYFFENMGNPIYNYNPTSPELSLEGDKTRFRINSNGTDVDFVSVTWAIEKSEGLIEWTIFHKKDETVFFRIPDFPTCLSFNQSWFSPEDFKLKSIESHHYQNFESYEEYINSRYGDEEGGEGSRLIYAGGNYEKKIINK